MLRRAIEQEWGKPLSIEVSEKKARLKVRSKEKDQQERAEDLEAETIKKKRRIARTHAAQVFSSMSDTQRHKLEEQAYEALTSDFHRRRFHSHEDFRQTCILDEICRQQDVASLSTS